MRIGLLSDTHSHLDSAIIRYLESCDEIWHAGDIGNIEIADSLAAYKPFRAVYGNIDGADLRRSYPENLVFEISGIKVFMTHIGGYPGHYPSRVSKQIHEYSPDLFICGHSHILKVMPDKANKLLHINPGAAGIHGFHHVRTLVRFSITDSKIHDLEVIELGKRGSMQSI